MDWKPDRQAKKALYKQLAEFIEHGISTGMYPPGQPLPSERQLASRFNLNRSTVVSAYDLLEAEGLILRKRGSGTTVNQDIWGIAKKRTPSWDRYIESGFFLPNIPLAQRIRKQIENNKLINLASGELSADLFPLKFFNKIISSKPFTGTLGYDHPLGNESLRNTIVRHLKEYRAIETNPSSILITSGAQQALHLVAQCLLKPGDAIALEIPSYHYSLPVLKSAGLRPFYLPVDKDGINPKQLLALHKKHRIRMIFLNPAFQNPTGATLSPSRRKELMEISLEYGIPIVEDDPYSLTSFSGEAVPPLKSLDENGNVLYLSSLSKIVASGLRIGWIIGPSSVIERLADAKQQVDFGHASFTQWVANEFLGSDHFSMHLHNLNKQLEKRKSQIIKSLNTYLQEYVDFEAPKGGIHLWCKINKTHNEAKLLQESIKRGVVYTPGSTLGPDKGYVRFTFSREDELNIDMGIRKFRDALLKG